MFTCSVKVMMYINSKLFETLRTAVQHYSQPNTSYTVHIPVAEIRCNGCVVKHCNTDDLNHPLHVCTRTVDFNTDDFDWSFVHTPTDPVELCALILRKLMDID